MADDIEPCPSCGALPCDWINDPRWKPIDTGPKAGNVLGRYDDRVTIIGWSERWGRWTDLGPGADHNKQPDAWMPMPAAH